MKIIPVGEELFHADRRSDGRTGIRLIVAFRNFAKASKNYKYNLKLYVFYITTSTTEAVAILYWLHKVSFRISCSTRTILTGSYWFSSDVQGKRCNGT
jgi:hypothetical protein